VITILQRHKRIRLAVTLLIFLIEYTPLQCGIWFWDQSVGSDLTAEVCDETFSCHVNLVIDFDVGQDCEFAAESFYVGQQLRGQIGCLKDASWIKQTASHCGNSVSRHRSREIVVTVDNVSVWYDTVCVRC